MKQALFFAFIIQCLSLSYGGSSLFSTTHQHMIHRPIDVSKSQNHLSRNLPIQQSNEFTATIHGINGDGDCLLYSLGITEPAHELRDPNEPWSTKNRSIVLKFIEESLHTFSSSSITALAFAIQEHFNEINHHQLYSSYKNRDDFCLEAAVHLEKMHRLDALLEGQEEREELLEIFSNITNSINKQLTENITLKDKALILLESMIKKTQKNPELHHFIHASLQNLSDEIKSAAFQASASDKPELRIYLNNLLSHSLQILASTRLHLSSEMCIFLAPMLKKNILLWQDQGATLKPTQYYPDRDLSLELSDPEISLTMEFGINRLTDPETLNIFFRNNHFEVITLLGTQASNQDSIEYVKAVHCLNQMKYSKK